MPRRGAQLTREAAEAIAAQGLAFLAEEPRRLSRFLSLTGLDPVDVPARVNDQAFLAAILEHLLEDESLLLVFAASASVAPETIPAALNILQGQDCP
jgi:hypothetical protein